MRVLESIQRAALSAALAQPTGIDRRQFLKLGGASGLVLGMQLPLAGCSREQAEAPAPDDAPEFIPNAFVRIAPDNRVTVLIKHHEMGQGTTTGLATILAEELDADWSLVNAEYAPSDPELYNNLIWGPVQGTGGSTAMANSWEQMREAGAAARAMLVAAAAEAWSVPAAEISAANSTLTHAASGRSARYGEMAERAAALEPPAEITLKDPADFTLIGKRDTRRLDSAAKSTGTATYTIDIKLPGLLTAMIARPPAFGARLKSFDATAARAVDGVTDVVEVPEGVAVVATGMWPALQGRDALEIEWDTPAEGVSTESLFEEYRALAGQPGAPVARSDNTAEALAAAAQTVEAVYEFPYLAHAAMEPMNCVAWLHDGMLETWSGHQLQTLDHQLAAQAAGLSPDKVKLHTLISGGSFGRRANPWSDFVVEAVHIAKAIDGRAPVRLQQTREDDMRGGLYRPQYVHAVRAGLDAEGGIRAWQHRIVGQSIIAGTVMDRGRIQDGIDPTVVEGVAPTPYAVPNMSVDLHLAEVGVRPLWWRSVGHTHTAYVMETMMDELAEAAGADPVDFRLALLDEDPRMAAALRLAADKAGWASAPPAGRARGVAVHHSFATWVAQVVEVSLADGQPRVHRVVLAVDCGTAINPDVVAAQMEGGVGFALAAALYGEIGIDKGAVAQSNFHDYQVLRINEMPQVEVHIVESGAPPTGVGEPGVPPLAPAVANAVYQLTGQRIRRLPFARHTLSSA